MSETDEEYAAVEDLDDGPRSLTWDLWVTRSATPDGQGLRQKIVETVPELIESIGGYDSYETVEEKKVLLRSFLGLRTAKAMPEDLRTKVEEFLK